MKKELGTPTNEVLLRKPAFQNQFEKLFYTPLKLYYLGVIIFQNHVYHSSHEAARGQCEFEGIDVDAGSKFLTLPRPKNLDENTLYFLTFWNDDRIAQKRETGDRYWLDISEVLPATDPRKWVYGDGTPVSWTNWNEGEPNNHGDAEPVHEPFVEVDPDQLWNDVSLETFRKFMCVHYLPVGAEETCPWLFDYRD